VVTTMEVVISSYRHVILVVRATRFLAGSHNICFEADPFQPPQRVTLTSSPHGRSEPLPRAQGSYDWADAYADSARLRPSNGTTMIGAGISANPGRHKKCVESRTGTFAGKSPDTKQTCCAGCVFSYEPCNDLTPRAGGNVPEDSQPGAGKSMEFP